MALVLVAAWFLSESLVLASIVIAGIAHNFITCGYSVVVTGRRVVDISIIMVSLTPRSTDLYSISNRPELAEVALPCSLVAFAEEFDGHGEYVCLIELKTCSGW